MSSNPGDGNDRPRWPRLPRPTDEVARGRLALICNIVWALRPLPYFGVFGSGEYKLQPIHVEDFATLAVRKALATAKPWGRVTAPSRPSSRDIHLPRTRPHHRLPAPGLRRATVVRVRRRACGWIVAWRRVRHAGGGCRPEAEPPSRRRAARRPDQARRAGPPPPSPPRPHLRQRTRPAPPVPTHKILFRSEQNSVRLACAGFSDTDAPWRDRFGS